MIPEKVTCKVHIQRSHMKSYVMNLILTEMTLESKI